MTARRAIRRLIAELALLDLSDVELAGHLAAAKRELSSMTGYFEQDHCCGLNETEETYDECDKHCCAVR
jgi:hypothetical protein